MGQPVVSKLQTQKTSKVGNGGPLASLVSVRDSHETDQESVAVVAQAKVPYDVQADDDLEDKKITSPANHTYNIIKTDAAEEKPDELQQKADQEYFVDITDRIMDSGLALEGASELGSPFSMKKI